jgi:NAD(P)-dependent dehydrogenase (short-subunit alcohol dehydrogenase family)
MEESSMHPGLPLRDAVVLITGANRGIGLALVHAARRRGARRVIAAMRTPQTLGLDGVESIALDVMRDDQVRAAAARCGDVSVLINNAGIAETGGFMAPGSLEACRKHLETNVFGVLRMCQAFAPVLAAQGGGAILNVLSVASWINVPVLGTYGLSKSAAWALTNGLRAELRGQGTLVCGLHVGFVDTDLVRQFEVPKVTPAQVAECALDGIEAGTEELLVDDRARQVKAGLTSDPPYYLTIGR